MALPSNMEMATIQTLARKKPKATAMKSPMPGKKTKKPIQEPLFWIQSCTFCSLAASSFRYFSIHSVLPNYHAGPIARPSQQDTCQYHLTAEWQDRSR